MSKYPPAKPGALDRSLVSWFILNVLLGGSRLGVPMRFQD